MDDNTLDTTLHGTSGTSGLKRIKPTKKSNSELDTMIIGKSNMGWDANRIAALYMIQKSYVDNIIKTQ